MKLLLFSLLFAVSCLRAETDTNLYDRVFFLLAPLDGLRVAPERPLSSEEKNKRLMDIYHDAFGVQWPAGSELVKDDSEWCNDIYVRNTHLQLSKLEAGIEKWGFSIGVRFPIEIALIAFDKEDIERLQTSGPITAESLMKLHKRGRSKPLSILKEAARCGQESEIKDVQEFIYPAEYSRRAATQTRHMKGSPSYYLRTLPRKKLAHYAASFWKAQAMMMGFSLFLLRLRIRH